MQHYLFETGVLEASDTQPTQLASAGVDIRQHDPTTSSYHMPPSNHPPDSTTSSTFSEATAENTGTCTPGGTESDVELCTEFVRKTCGCVKGNGKPCNTLFSVEYYIEHRSLASLLTRQELNLVLLGSIMTTVMDRDSIVDGRHKLNIKKSHHVT